MAKITEVSSLTIVDIARSPYVKRWNSIAVQRAQNVAEHSFLTTMYAQNIAERIYPKFKLEDKLKLMEYCLWHDIPEVVTGDLPTPLKRIIESIQPGLIDSIEVKVCPKVKELQQAINNTPLKNIAKLADMLDAIIFLHHEGKEKTAFDIKDKLIKRFHDFVQESADKYPQLLWNNTYKILDELLTKVGQQLEFDWSQIGKN